MRQDIRKKILERADVKYAVFSKKIVQTKKRLVGVRLPILRSLAKEFLQKEEKVDLISFVLDKKDDDFFEEVMLKGFLIANIKIPFKKKLSLISSFVKQIDNWSICDSFCSALKIYPSEKDEFLEFLKKYFLSKKEFYYRFGIVCFMRFYLDESHKTLFWDILRKDIPPFRGAEMGAAWAISVAAVKFTDDTFSFLRDATFLSDKIFFAATQKIRDSLRIKDNYKKETFLLRKK